MDIFKDCSKTRKNAFEYNGGNTTDVQPLRAVTHMDSSDQLMAGGSHYTTLIPTNGSVGMDRNPKEHVDDGNGGKICVVCTEPASGVYFGALVCLPCKSFFIRCTKDSPNPTFDCAGKGDCEITKESRLRCQKCRFQRCLLAGMCRKEKPEVVLPSSGQELCRVCNDIANGIHFGIYTCEGCKKFFRRGLKEAEIYECKIGARCPINPRSRNACRFCRFQKCINVGMSREAIRMGRPKKGGDSLQLKDAYTALQELQKEHEITQSTAQQDPIDVIIKTEPRYGQTYGVDSNEGDAQRQNVYAPDAQQLTDHHRPQSIYEYEQTQMTHGSIAYTGTSAPAAIEVARSEGDPHVSPGEVHVPSEQRYTEAAPTFDLDDMEEFLKILNEGKYPKVNADGIHQILEETTHNRQTHGHIEKITTQGSLVVQEKPMSNQHPISVYSSSTNQLQGMLGANGTSQQLHIASEPVGTVLNKNIGTAQYGHSFLAMRDHVNGDGLVFQGIKDVARGLPTESVHMADAYPVSLQNAVTSCPEPLILSSTSIAQTPGMNNYITRAASVSMNGRQDTKASNGVTINSQVLKRPLTDDGTNSAKLFRKDYWSMTIDPLTLPSLSDEPTIRLLSAIQEGYENMVLQSDETINNPFHDGSGGPKPNEPMWKFVVKKRIIRNLRGSIAYAHKIPGFSELEASDKFYLCRYGGFHMMIILASREQYDPVANTCKHFFNSELPPENPAYQIRCDILQAAKQLHALKLDIKEASCLGSLALISPDWLTTLNRKLLIGITNRVRDAFFSYVLDKHGKVIGTRRLMEMLALMPQLREIAIAHAEYSRNVKFQLDENELTSIFTGINLNEK